MPIGQPGCAFLILIAAASIPSPARAHDWHVAPGGSGDGTRNAPFGRIQDGLAAAQPGDVILVAPGTFHETLRTVRPGTADEPIVVRGTGARGAVIVTSRGRVASIGHPHTHLESLVFDGQFGPDDIIRVGSSATGFTLRTSEVRRGSRDGIDLGAVQDVLVEDTLVHHTLNAEEGRTDAHGIVAGAVRRLTIRRTEIHTFSGDAVQVDPGRSSPGWDEVLIEDCRFWLAPLPAAVNGFAAGAVPGENAVDTKVGAGLPRGRLTIRRTEAFGYRGGLIGNMAAFNIKEGVEAVIDAVTIHTSEIAFRLRAPATVRIQNAVVHDVGTAVRYEDDLAGLRIFSSTFGAGIERAFQAAASARSTLVVRNVAILGRRLPPEMSHPSNRALPESAFMDVHRHDYRLAPGSPAIDAGITLEDVRADREGMSRPQGTGHDVGAYERPAARKRAAVQSKPRLPGRASPQPMDSGY